MTLTALRSPGLVLAMSAPAESGANPWVQLIPFALVLAIFYFLILLPMQRKQKKSAVRRRLKVGDRWSPPAGFTGRSPGSRQERTQIADKVRIEIPWRAATRAGPVAPDAAGHRNVMDKNSLAPRYPRRRRDFHLGLSPPERRSLPRPQGGVHRARRPTDERSGPTPRRRISCGGRGGQAQRHLRPRRPARFKVDGVPQPGRRVPGRPRDRHGSTGDPARAVKGSDEPNMISARGTRSAGPQTIDGRRAGRGADRGTARRATDPAAAGVANPARKDIIRRFNAGLSRRDGLPARRNSCSTRGGVVPGNMESSRRQRHWGPRRPRRDGYYMCGRSPR
jgi:preprotein translocase subunit YajC